MRKRNVIIIMSIVILILILGFISFYFFNKYIELEKSKPAKGAEELSDYDLKQEIERLSGHEESCFDSDNGTDYSVKGYTVLYRTDLDYRTKMYSHGIFEKRFDSCVDSFDDGEYVNSSKYLVEYFCGELKSSQTIECDNICKDGACI